MTASRLPFSPFTTALGSFEAIAGPAMPGAVPAITPAVATTAANAMFRAVLATLCHANLPSSLSVSRDRPWGVADKMPLLPAGLPRRAVRSRLISCRGQHYRRYLYGCANLLLRRNSDAAFR